jgi:hypothetical protein
MEEILHFSNNRRRRDIPSFQRKLESDFFKRWKEKRFQLSLE